MTVPFGVLRERATQIDVASSFPRHMSVTHAQADVIVCNAFRKAIQCNPKAVEFKLDYDQGLVNCIRALREKDYGLAKNIKWVRFDWKVGNIKIKLKEPMEWNQ